MGAFEERFGNNSGRGELSNSLLERSKTDQKHPAMYQVLIINDDFTTMEFVVMLLKKIFHKSDQQSVEIMLQTHYTGEGKCGIYTRDVAETKMMQVIDIARENNFPLKCIIRKE